MKYTEIKDLNLAEIQKRLVQNKQNLFDVRIKHKMQRQSNPLQIRFLKKDISRLQTVLSSLPASAFTSSSPKKMTPATDTQKSAKPKPQPVKKAVKKATEKKTEQPTTAAAQSQEKQAKEVKKEKKKSWFGFMGSKAKQDKNLKAVSKKSFFRRKSG